VVRSTVEDLILTVLQMFVMFQNTYEVQIIHIRHLNPCWHTALIFTP